MAEAEAHCPRPLPEEERETERRKRKKATAVIARIAQRTRATDLLARAFAHAAAVRCALWRKTGGVQRAGGGGEGERRGRRRVKCRHKQKKRRSTCLAPCTPFSPLLYDVVIFVLLCFSFISGCDRIFIFL